MNPLSLTVCLFVIVGLTLGPSCRVRKSFQSEYVNIFTDGFLDIEREIFLYREFIRDGELESEGMGGFDTEGKKTRTIAYYLVEKLR